MPNYVIYPDSTSFPDTETAYFVTAVNEDAAISQAASVYDLGGDFKVDKLGTSPSRYGVAVNVASKIITQL